MHFFARSYRSDSESQAAYRDIVAVLDGLGFDSYSITAVSDGVEIVVVGTQHADALLDADLPLSWIKAPGHRLSAESIAALAARCDRLSKTCTAGDRRDVVFATRRTLGPDGRLQRSQPSSRT